MDANIMANKAELLKSAIKGEVDGYTFYNLLAEKTENLEAKKRLEGLRDDEKRHKTILVELYRKHIGGDLGELPAKGIGPLAAVFEKGKLKKLKSDMEYISLAIEAELATTRFYLEASRQTKDPDLRDILQELSEEENGHYEILMAEKQAIGGNYYWFGQDQSAPLED